MPGFTLHLRDQRGLCRWFVAWVRAWVLGVCCLASGVVAAQALPLRYHLQSDGLSNLAVTALVQHPDGRLWIGTENGLYRHDGMRIERVDDVEAAMGTRHITALLGDEQGGLWVGTEEALFHWSEDGLVPVRAGAVGISVRQGQAMAMTADGVALVVSEGGLLAVQRDAAAGVWRARPALPEAALRGEPALASIHSVLVDADGAWWLGCDHKLCRWKDGALESWGEGQGLGFSRWAGLLRASDGALWVRSQEQVLRRPAGAQGFEDVTPRDLSQGTVHRQQPLVEDSDGRVMTESDSGLLRWSAGHWTHFGAAHGLTVGGGVHAILVDRDRDVWLGTAGHGLAHWRGYRHWSNWTSAQGLPSDDVWSFVDEAPGALWIGTGSGAVMLEQGRDDAARFTKPSGTTHQVGSIVRDAAGLRWMGTYSGELFYRRDGSPWQRAATGMPLIFKLLPATDGGLWISTYAGLYRMEPGSTRQAGAAPHKVDLKMKAPPAIYTACTSPDGQAWFGTSKGLLMHDAARGLTQPAIQGLPKELSIEKIVCGADGTLWIAGAQSNRMWRLRGTPEGWQAQALNPSILGRRNVMGLLVDRRAWLWVTTDDGVAVWNGRQWRRFDESNGLVWSDCNQNALHEDAAGNIWIGTSRGVSQVLRPELLFVPARLELHITRVHHQGRAQPVDRPWTAERSTAPLEIEWTVPAFANRSAQRVLYRLLGLGEQWNAAQHDNISFAALPAGRYTFEAVAENLDTGQKSAPVSIGFEILPPWWLNPWLLAAYMLMAAALLALAYRWRVRLLMRRQRELESLVSSRTAELEVSYERMRTLALTDGLTGAMNRRAIMELAARELARAARGEVPVAFVLLDVDHFKRINDTHGHLAGDAVLKQLAERLHGVMRAYDAFGRYGGEEFLLVLPGLSLAAEEGMRRVEAIQRSIAQQPFDLGNGQEMTVTCSAGAVGALAGETSALEALIDRADAALYNAKRDGRNRVAMAEKS